MGQYVKREILKTLTFNKLLAFLRGFGGGRISVWAPEPSACQRDGVTDHDHEFSPGEITDLSGSWWEMSPSTKMEL